MLEPFCGVLNVLCGNRIGCVMKIFEKLLKSEVVEGFGTVGWG